MLHLAYAARGGDARLDPKLDATILTLGGQDDLIEERVTDSVSIWSKPEDHPGGVQHKTQLLNANRSLFAKPSTQFAAEKLLMGGGDEEDDDTRGGGAAGEDEVMLGEGGREAGGEKRATTKKCCYAVLYLAPGDYHRFHSPCESFRLMCGRHFPGEVLPVHKYFLRWLSDLFCLNERVVLSGEWEQGQMHMAAVAAYNVGNIW